MTARPAFHITRLREIVALGVLVTIGNLTPYALPVIVGALVDHLHVAPSMAGYLGTAELVGLGAGAAIFSRVILRVNWRAFALLAITLSALANLATPFAPGLVALFAIRLVSGLGGGMLLAMAAAGLSSTRTPERTLGSVQIFGMMFSGVALYALPLVLDRAGGVAMFALIAAANVAAAALVLVAPRRSPYAEGMARAGIVRAADAPAPPLLITTSTLAGITLYFIAAMGFWVFFERVGHAAALPVARIAQVLGTSQFFGAAGALTAVVVATRLGNRIVPMMIALLIAIAASLLMTTHVDVARYAIAAFGFSFAWSVIYPYMMGIAISLDPSARVVGYALALQTAGKAVGPALASTVVMGTAYSGAYWLSFALFVGALVAFLPAILHTDALLSARRTAPTLAPLGAEIPAG